MRIYTSMKRRYGETGYSYYCRQTLLSYVEVEFLRRHLLSVLLENDIFTEQVSIARSLNVKRVHVTVVVHAVRV